MKQSLSLDSYGCYIGKHAAFTSSMSIDIPKSVAESSPMKVDILRLATFTSFMLMGILKSVAEGGGGLCVRERQKESREESRL